MKPGWYPRMLVWVFLVGLLAITALSMERIDTVRGLRLASVWAVWVVFTMAVRRAWSDKRVKGASKDG